MKRYTIFIKTSAQKQMKKLLPGVRSALDVQIRELADNPRPTGCKKLSGYENLYRIRQGDYRILYTVEDERLTIEIIRVGNRRDVYE